MVPGDIVYLTNHMIIPADCVLIEGEAVVNESMLTGESVPINKEAISQKDELFTFQNS